MTASGRKTPQQKKALSYARDRRNSYGENNKASRKLIPRRKASEHRQDRHKLDQETRQLAIIDETAADIAASAIRQDLNRRKTWRWKKQPDRSLAEHLKWKRTTRAEHDRREE
jgi:hypothetical protein